MCFVLSALRVNGVILSGNIAYILYGAVLAAAAVGWRQGRWTWFYGAVLVASSFKPHLLTLLAIPMLSTRRQWLPAGVTACAGTLLFLSQPILWPVLFRNCIQAIKVQMLYNRDFGAGPAGMFAGYLSDHSLGYLRGSYILYFAYALPLCGFLSYLSRKFMRGSFPLTRWIPVLLSGVLLLNPRIQEYDLAILSLPLALIVWRLFPGLQRSWLRAAIVFTAFVLLNVAASRSWIVWKDTACGLLVVLFSAAARQLLRQYP